MGDTAYVIGGYTGSTALRSIVAFRPGAPTRVVAKLPVALRYAAVAAVAGRVMIAGGTVGSSLSSAIFAFDPQSRRVTRVGSLPAPLTHAAGATLGGDFYVIGGRRRLLGSQTPNIVRVDPSSGRAQRSGRLSQPLSDAGALPQGARILVVGGRDSRGQARQDLISLQSAR